MFILKAILVLIIIGFLFCVVVVLRLAWSARYLFQMFRGGQPTRQDDGTYGETIKTDGGTIVDRRSAQEVNRKIIADDEGEYVEYEEA